MKLRTIWTLPLMTIAVKLWYTRDKLAETVSGLLPTRVRYWVALREIHAAAMKTEEGVYAPVWDILQNLNVPKGPFADNDKENDMSDPNLTPEQLAELEEKVQKLRDQAEEAVNNPNIDWNKDDK